MQNKGRTRRRGMALVTTMLVLMGIMALVLLGSLANNNGPTGSNNGAMVTTGNSMQMSSARMQSINAFNLAESGIDYTLQWMHAQAAPPAQMSAFAPSLWNSSQTGTPARSVVSFGSGSFSIEIYPDSGNSGNPQKRYVIESVGTSGGATQILQAYVQQSSFGKYAYFTNTDPGNAYWVCGMNTFDGPMHSNNSDGVPTNIIWFNAAGSPPMFTASGNYECVAPTIGWNLNGIGNQTAPTGNDWTKVAAGGAPAVQTGVPSVAMPTASTMQEFAALGLPPPASPSSVPSSVPSTTGVTVTPGGGLYIHNPVQQMTLSVQNSVNQVIYVKQVDPVSNNKIETTITLNAQTNQTTQQIKITAPNGTDISPTTQPSPITGTTNGVLYCDSDIGGQGSPKTGGLSGQIADNKYNGSGTQTRFSGLTISTPSNKNMNIDGSLTYNTARAKFQTGDTLPAGYNVGDYKPESMDPTFTKNAGTLGLVSNNVEIVDNDASGSALNNVEVDASVLAYGTYDATGIYSRPKGTFLNMGGYIAAAAGSFGVINGSGQLQNGLAENYHYDQRLANTPPPYFPTTGNAYDVVSWQRVSQTLQ